MVGTGSAWSLGYYIDCGVEDWEYVEKGAYVRIIV